MADGSGARATSRLDFALDATGRTYLARQHVGYPLHVTRAFALADDVAGMSTLYLQSSSGGLFQGDDVELSVDVAPGAAAHVTTQAATIAHAMPAAPARFAVTLGVAAGGLLEYLPDPLILIPGCRVDASIAATVHDDATLIVADGFLGHDPEAQARPPVGGLTTTLAVARPDGRCIGLDRARVEAAAMDGFAAHGTFVVVTPAAGDLADALVAALADRAGIYGGASRTVWGATARVLARDGQALNGAIDSLWHAARRVLVGADPPRRRK